MRFLAPVAAALAAACWSSPPADVTLREFSATRPSADEPLLTARLEYAAGTLRLRPAPVGTLYRMQLEYNAEHFEPLAWFDGDAALVRLGVQSLGGGASRPRGGETFAQSATIELSPATDLVLEATLGAVDAHLEMGGLRLTDLNLSIGASRSVVRFTDPNPATCRRARISAGAAQLTVEGLGHSGCREIVVEGGVGRAVLDFTGSWPASARAKLNMTVGGVRLILPRAVGIRLTLDRFLASFQPAGLERQGNTNVYQSIGYDATGRTLEIAVSTTLGGVEVEWR